MHKALKIPLIIFLAILFTACVAIDGWYLYILLKSPDKIVETTYKIGLQETTDGEQRHFIEINYMSNDNKNGLELFEIKYNYMLDEKQEDFYSQGLQYVSYNNNLGWSYYTEPDKFYRSSKYGSWPAYYYDDYYMGSYHPNKDTQVFNYMSADNYEKSTLISTNPIGDTTSFKIQVGDDLFLMKFRGNLTKLYIF